jgi:hypothetical protein
MCRVSFWDRFLGGRSALPALLVCASLTGCGSGDGEVTGTVRYKGKPLSFGTIQFLGQDSRPRAAPIQPDGSFLVQVPTGKAKVIVSCVDEAKLKHLAPQSVAGDGRSAAGRLANANISLIPRRYADWDASGLTVVVETGQTVQDFALPPN